MKSPFICSWMSDVSFYDCPYFSGRMVTADRSLENYEILHSYRTNPTNLCGFVELSIVAMEMDRRVDFFIKLVDFNNPPDTREARK